MLSTLRANALAATVLVSAFFAVNAAMAYEQLPYTVLETNKDFELRQYPPYLVAEVEVSGDFEAVGNEAFGPLFDYISGANQQSQDIAMTVPVNMDAAKDTGQPIEMGAPVTQSAMTSSGGRYRFSFVMPSQYELDSLPKPTDPQIRIRESAGGLVAALRYSGTWSESNYREHERQLLEDVAKRGLTVIGEPIFARYNSPFSLWFMRRNEVLVAVRQ